LWGLTEFNITYNNPDDLSTEGIAVPSFINGQFWVDIFAMAMEYGAFTATPWCIQESDRASSYFGYVGAPPDFVPHSTYYHTQMMADNMKGEFIKMNSGNPFVKAFGSVDDNKSTILLMNQDSLKTFSFDFNRLNLDMIDNKLAISSAYPIKANYSGNISPNTTLLFVFDNNGSLIKHLVYNLEMAVKRLPPQVINK
jgi:hypothetical protein